MQPNAVAISISLFYGVAVIALQDASVCTSLYILRAHLGFPGDYSQVIRVG